MWRLGREFPQPIANAGRLLRVAQVRQRKCHLPQPMGGGHLQCRRLPEKKDAGAFKEWPAFARCSRPVLLRVHL
jgi:hypothetical protein